MPYDPILPAFSVELAGSFHTFKLLDSAGRPITDMWRAAEFAECEFSGDWNSVFNGDESIEREDYLDGIDTML